MTTLLLLKRRRGSAGSSDGGQNRTGRTADEEENRTGPSPGPGAVFYSAANSSAVCVQTGDSDYCLLMVKLLWSTLEMLLLLMTLLLLAPLHGECVRVAVFSRAGEAAVLPCADVMSGDPLCSSTEWVYSNGRGPGVKVVSKGEVQQSGRSERLRLLPNCSLHISDVSPEDAGWYQCLQYNGSDLTTQTFLCQVKIPQEDLRSCLASCPSMMVIGMIWVCV
ncbi:uncharacterized protein LOC134468734 [Engraulis encrasicolus]|uniref:uncharacterized protein LOC134468734 n=1 Tax=Engraulis encrasicolus TaxID=184585 RepID=UPI002FD25FC4